MLVIFARQQNVQFFQLLLLKTKMHFAFIKAEQSSKFCLALIYLQMAVYADVGASITRRDAAKCLSIRTQSLESFHSSRFIYCWM